MDMEKVVEGLNTCAHPPLGRFCKGCPYYENANCSIDLMSDALGLLKEQEGIIKQYQKADGFLFAHGWKWEGR